MLFFCKQINFTVNNKKSILINYFYYDFFDNTI